MQASFNEQRLTWILDLLIREGRLHRGQKSDVLNRGSEQARHILLDKRAELRKLLGKQRRGHRSLRWARAAANASVKARWSKEARRLPVLASVRGSLIKSVWRRNLKRVMGSLTWTAWMVVLRRVLLETALVQRARKGWKERCSRCRA